MRFNAFAALLGCSGSTNGHPLRLPFDERACFIAGAAKSGTTLLVSLLDSHPELLVMPQDTAYFPTVLTKYGSRGRKAQRRSSGRSGQSSPIAAA